MTDGTGASILQARPLSPRAWLSAGLACLVVCCGCGGASGDGPAGPGGPGGGNGGPVAPAPQFKVLLPDLTASPGPVAGSVHLRFTAPASADGGPVDAYVARVAVRHFDADSLSLSSAVAVPQAPAPPGNPEQILLAGLEPGRTLQFALQVVHDGISEPAGLTVAARVTGSVVPSTPAAALSLTAGSTLDLEGATYRLTRDIVTTGTAFRVTARDVTLDLGGHRVTYGTLPGRAHGVEAAGLWNRGTLVIRNGTLVQGAGSAARSHGVFVDGAHAVRVSALRVETIAADSDGIRVQDTTSSVRVDHCTVLCRTTVVTNRHYPGVSAIVVEGAASAEVDQNRVEASPQWGIKVQGEDGPALVHHNVVTGTRATVANGYMIGVYQPDADVFENLCAGESRGIHVDGRDAHGNRAHVHDNELRVQDQPNAEYPDAHWVHGIKVEGADGVRIERNRVLGTADPAHAEVRALDLDTAGASGLLVRHNRFHARSLTRDMEAHALQWTAGPDDPPNDAQIVQNVFLATDHAVHRAWDAGVGATCRENWWLRDLSLGLVHPFTFEHFETSETQHSPGHRFLDPVTDLSVFSVAQWADPAGYESTREWSLLVRARGAGGAPASGARVTVRDRTGAIAFTATAGPDGLASGRVVAARITEGPTIDDRNPFTIAVETAAHGSWQGVRTVGGRTALLVDLATGTAADDATAPPPPPAASAHPLSASRLLLRWDPPADDSRAVLYLVSLAGEPAGVTDQTSFVCTGLVPGALHAPEIVAVDAGGRRSQPARPLAVRTPAEDRGP